MPLTWKAWFRLLTCVLVLRVCPLIIRLSFRIRCRMRVLCADTGGAAFTKLVEAIEAAQRRRAQVALLMAILHTAGFDSDRQ